MRFAPFFILAIIILLIILHRKGYDLGFWAYSALFLFLFISLVGMFTAGIYLFSYFFCLGVSDLILYFRRF